jgi:hypothetical protein
VTPEERRKALWDAGSTLQQAALVEQWIAEARSQTAEALAVEYLNWAALATNEDMAGAWRVAAHRAREAGAP